METQNGIDWTQYKLSKAGEIKKAKISLLEKGTLKDFVNAQGLPKWRNCNGTEPAVRVWAQTEDLQYKASMVFLLKDITFGPNTPLNKYVNRYGDWPTLNQQVEIRTDLNGRWKVTL